MRPFVLCVIELLVRGSRFHTVCGPLPVPDDFAQWGLHINRTESSAVRRLRTGFLGVPSRGSASKGPQLEVLLLGFLFKISGEHCTPRSLYFGAKICTCQGICSRGLCIERTQYNGYRNQQRNKKKSLVSRLISEIE